MVALRERFPDVEQLAPSGYLADCPLHDVTERRFVFFTEVGALIGCSSGQCSRQRILSDAAHFAHLRRTLAWRALTEDPDNTEAKALLELLGIGHVRTG